MDDHICSLKNQRQAELEEDRKLLEAEAALKPGKTPKKSSQDPSQSAQKRPMSGSKPALPAGGSLFLTSVDIASFIGLL